MSTSLEETHEGPVSKWQRWLQHPGKIWCVGSFSRLTCSWEWYKPGAGLFVAQGDDGIEARGFACGK
jgi:hypothetical protein